MKKLVLWQSGEIEAEEKALGVLAGLYSQIVVVGAVYDLFTTGGAFIAFEWAGSPQA